MELNELIRQKIVDHMELDEGWKDAAIEVAKGTQKVIVKGGDALIRGTKKAVVKTAKVGVDVLDRTTKAVTRGTPLAVIGAATGLVNGMVNPELKKKKKP